MTTPDKARRIATAIDNAWFENVDPERVDIETVQSVLRELAKQIEDLQAAQRGATFTDLADQIDLQADAARLDWMGKKLAGASDSERYLPFRIYWGGGSHKTIRQVIDEAMK